MAAGHESFRGSAFISATAARLSASDVVMEPSFAVTSWPKWTSEAPIHERMLDAPNVRGADKRRADRERESRI